MSSPGTTEKQNITVGVLHFETTQSIIGVFKWLKERHITRRKFSRECVGVRHVYICVPAGDTLFDIPRIVRYGRHAYVFEQDLRTTSADDAKKNVARFRALEGNVKSKFVPIKGKRCRDVPHNKKGRNACNPC